MSRLIDTAPERIFLCVSDDLADINRPFTEVSPEDEAITWSTKRAVAASVCYVRADLHDEAITVLRARAGRAEDKLEEARKILQDARASMTTFDRRVDQIMLKDAP